MKPVSRSISTRATPIQRESKEVCRSLGENTSETCEEDGKAKDKEGLETDIEHASTDKAAKMLPKKPRKNLDKRVRRGVTIGTQVSQNFKSMKLRNKAKRRPFGRRR